MFCSIYNTIERCKLEGVVDVFQAVKSLRIHRPGAIQTVVSSHGQILIGGLQIQFILNFIASFYNSTVNSNVSVLLI